MNKVILLDYSVSSRFYIVEINPENCYVAAECNFGFLNKIYRLQVRLIKDASVKQYGYRNESNCETEDYLELQKLVDPDELIRGQNYLIGRALEMSSYLDSLIDRVRAERNCKKALEALPVSTEKRKKASL